MSQAGLFRKIRDKAAELSAEDYSRKSSSEPKAILRDTNSSHMLRSVAERVLASRGVTTCKAAWVAIGPGHEEIVQDAKASADGTEASHHAHTGEGWNHRQIRWTRLEVVHV